MDKKDTQVGARVMTEDEILESVKQQFDAARRRYSSGKDGASICQSLPRKASGKISARERRELQDFGDQFY